MLEILFTESAAGSMKAAKNLKYCAGSSILLILRNEDGSIPTPEELARKQAQVEEEYRKKLKNAVVMEGSSSDVLYFPLKLSMGDILEPFSDGRADFHQSTVMIKDERFADVGQQMMAAARRSLERLRDADEPIRIWYSHNPDELCGLCHILMQIADNADIRLVELPRSELRGDELLCYTGWGDIDPFEMGRFQALERPLTAAERRGYEEQWRALQRENGPLRAVVNGKLVTVQADHYDELILREIYHQPQRFHEARLIGKILGKYHLGLGDFQIAWRIEEFISRGILTPATEPEEHDPIYHRELTRVRIQLENDDWRLLSVEADELMYRDIDPTDGEELGLHARHLTHCAFCWTPVERTRHQRWFIPEEQTCCICENCFRDFRELFHWNELDGWDLEWKTEE